MRLVSLLLTCLLSSACGTTPNSTQSTKATLTPAQSERNLHSYAKEMVLEMLNTMQPLNKQAAIAVGTFLPADTLSLSPQQNQSYNLANQLQESMQTLFTQVGAEIVEFRTSQEIGIAEHQDRMLTRHIEQLNNQFEVDYFLAGTLTSQHDGYLVNSKLIDTNTQQVVSAATLLVPRNVLWQDEKVIQRNGLLYRSEN